MIAHIALREAPHYRRNIFDTGFKKLGYKTHFGITKACENDVLVIWNRYGIYHDKAKEFESAGAKVLVVENAYLSKEQLKNNEHWLAISLNHHAGAGFWQCGDNSRWDNLNVELAEWRRNGEETLVLMQRGIGEPGVAMPSNWTFKKGRIRKHPGKVCNTQISLEKDLSKAKEVVTWASSAALHALILGIPVFYDFKKWIGASACKHISLHGFEDPMMSNEARTNMFRRLIWAQWTRSEIESGEALEHLIKSN